MPKPREGVLSDKVLLTSILTERAPCGIKPRSTTTLLSLTEAPHQLAMPGTNVKVPLEASLLMH